MAAQYLLYSYAIIYSVVFSLHHLLFGSQVYHSLLLLDLFKLSFQCMVLTALFVTATTVALYWLCFAIFILSLSLCLCTLHIAFHSWAGPPCCPPREAHASSGYLLHFIYCIPLCWAQFPEIYTVYLALLTMLPSHGALGLDSPGYICLWPSLPKGQVSGLGHSLGNCTLAA